jgi:predicted nucleotidyltransferase component of viral defense system
MEQTLLTDRQKRVIEMLAGDEKFSKWYLSGGTALSAYHLNHRISDDLDFFTADEVDTAFLHSFVDSLVSDLSAVKHDYRRLYDRNIFVLQFDNEELKMEFTLYPFDQLDPPLSTDGIRVDSLRDIAANKLMVLLDRFDPKDFVDLYYLLSQFDLGDVQIDAERKFKTVLSPFVIGRAMAKVKRVKALPQMIKPLEVSDLKRFFEAVVKELQDDVVGE